MKTVLHAVFLTLICFAFGSCHYDKYDTLIKPGLPVTKPVVISDSIVIKYSTDIVPILSNNCYRCHDASHKALGLGFELDSYNGLHSFCVPNNPANDSTCQLVESITHTNTSPTLYMPNDGAVVKDSDIAVIVKWVFQGAKNN